MFRTQCQLMIAGREVNSSEYQYDTKIYDVVASVSLFLLSIRAVNGF